MYSYKNIKYINEIKKWNTAQLIEALETNGLGDCCEAIQIRQIDGDSFLNLTEGQLAFWKNTLNNVQIKRLWSYIQLARENPQNFITSFSQNQSTPTVTQNARKISNEKPQDFNRNIPQNKPTPTGMLNTRKVEKIKSPIAESLENILGQQNNPTEIPESNYPKLKPPSTPNESQLPVSPRPGVLPPKPSNLVKRFPAPPPVDVNSLPSTPPFTPSFRNSSSSQQYEEEEEEDFYEDEPVLELQNKQNKMPPPLPPVNSSTLYKIQTPLPEQIRKEKPLPPPINIKNYNIPQQEPEEEDEYEEEPMFESQNMPPPLPPPNLSPVYKVPLSNPIPIRREVPKPINYGRKLPTPPRDEIPFPLPPNVVPITRNARSPQPPDMADLPRPPISFMPPAHISDFHHDDEDEDDLVEYDVVDEAQPEYKLQSWFKDIERKEAIKLLRGLSNGTFIARPSTQSEYECTFSVVYERKIYNLPVMKVDDKVVLGKNAFDTVMEIVDKFSNTPLVLNGPNNEDVYLCLRKYGKM